MEIEIDTKTLIETALAKVFAEVDLDQVVKAMADKLFAMKGEGYGRSSLVEQIVEQAITNVAGEACAEILRDRKDLIKQRLIEKFGDELVDKAVNAVKIDRY